MRYVLNLLYLSLLFVLSPWLIYKMLTTTKYRRGLWSKLTGNPFVHLPEKGEHRRVWFHGVSVGEVLMMRPLISVLRQRRPDWQFVVSTTTDTGYDEACKRYADLPVIFWPFDFSWSVSRALAEVQPDMIVLSESEVWPNFLRCARRNRIPVALVNGRMSPRSAKRYRRIGFIARRVLSLIDLLSMQTREYADNLRTLGIPEGKLAVTGNIKYDGVERDRGNPKTQELRRLLNVGKGDLVWIVGSTQAPEETVALACFRKLQPQLPRLRLIIVPRQKERFEEVAGLLERSGVSFVRRSRINGRASERFPVILVDSIGELGALWGLADVAFVGGSLDGRRGGQNMIEPAAYGAAVVFGPHVWNFRADVERLLSAGAAYQIQNADELERVVRKLLTDVDERQRIGNNARVLVEAQQGATQMTVKLLEGLLHEGTHEQRAA